jgi:hypothetical protein
MVVRRARILRVCRDDGLMPGLWLSKTAAVLLTRLVVLWPFLAGSRMLTDDPSGAR